jgi:hypothetical protein
MMHPVLHPCVVICFKSNHACVTLLRPLLSTTLYSQHTHHANIWPCTSINSWHYLLLPYT